MYKIAKVFQSMKKDAEKEKKGHRRVKDSKEKEELETELAALVVTHTVQHQIREFKVLLSSQGGCHFNLSIDVFLHETFPSVLHLIYSSYLSTSWSSSELTVVVLYLLGAHSCH